MTSDAITMTVVTPITTPRMVSALRSLLARMASSASTTPSATLLIRKAIGYSLRRAVIGSSFAARVAGYTPKMMPVLAPSSSATPTDQPVTRAGSGE